MVGLRICNDLSFFRSEDWRNENFLVYFTIIKLQVKICYLSRWHRSRRFCDKSGKKSISPTWGRHAVSTIESGSHCWRARVITIKRVVRNKLLGERYHWVYWKPSLRERIQSPRDMYSIFIDILYRIIQTWQNMFVTHLHSSVVILGYRIEVDVSENAWPKKYAYQTLTPYLLHNYGQR